MNLETYGLPPCLHIPVAAASVSVLEQFVGTVLERRTSRAGRMNALLIQPHHVPSRTAGVLLWHEPNARECFARLHPERQVWVHVDHNGYRDSWRKFKMPDPGANFLDHVLNRRAIRLLKSAHPYLRLCPVSRRVNTSSGGVHGGEGRQCEFLANLNSYSEGIQAAVWKTSEEPLRLADPMDLTKMLNLPPGTKTLDGVRDVQHLFYVSGK